MLSSCGAAGFSTAKKRGEFSKDPTTSVLTRSELGAMHKLAAGVEVGAGAAVASVDTRKLNADDARAARAQRAAERKERMMAFDEERRAHGTEVKSMEDIEREMKRQEDRARARTKLNEGIDEVKHMNQVMLYAKCVTVRDAQVLEKKAIKAESAESERQQDMAMELERLKALRMYEEREQKRVEDRKKGAAVIRAQIDEREQERLRKVEIKQQEQDAMLSHIERMKDEDRHETVRRKEASAKLMEDVTVANAEQIRLKARQREMELEEDRMIAAYIKEKEGRDQEVLDEQRRLKAEKEREIARLRAMQEKAQDKRAEVDALRARRAQEAYEREWRQREKDSAARAAAVNAELRQAREQQMADKEALLAGQANAEREEFDRIVASRKLTEEAERNRREHDAKLRRGNAESLAKQIAEVEEGRKKERRDFLEEGRKVKTEARDREALIDEIRRGKLDELQDMQVPQQYRVEILKKKKTTEPLRPAK